MGQKIVPKWKDKSLIEKVLTISAGIISIAIIILAMMQMTGIWENAINVFEPLLGVLMLLNALNFYKYNKRVALFNLGAALFIFIISCVIFLHLF